MNSHCFKTVFSKRQGALVAVGEHASNQGKATGAGVGGSFGGLSSFVGALTVGFALVGLAWAGPVATALPTGGQVAQGAASINTSGAVMNINQSTAKAVVNWSSFDIGSGAKVNIVQPGADAVMLNRVTGANPSQIFGQLNANGQVVLVNPNGVLFGKDGSVSATSFTASTLGISDANFMAGNNQFERNGSTAAVVNQGSIKTTGGYVALLGASVSNEGKIETQGGTAYLAAAETVKIPVTGSGRIKLELSPSSINAAVSNAKGATIVTEGGQVYMQAAALNNAVASILQSGSIDTTGEQGGAVHLLADGGQIKVDGSITANSTGQDDNKQPRKGGSIVIGRDEETGVLAKATDVSGAMLESKGGFVETSGEYLATDGVAIKAAQWLLDPSNITISSATDSSITNTSGNIVPTGGNGTTSVVSVSTIQNAINSGTSVTIQTTNSNDTTSAGNITIANALAFKNTGATDATLSLIADNGITQNTGATITTDLVNSTKLVNISMTAKGNYQGIVSSSASSLGVVLNSSISTNGTVSVSGTSNSTGTSAGVQFGSGAGITTQGSAITINGTATAGTGTGVSFNNTLLNAGTAGDIAVTGTSVGSHGIYNPGTASAYNMKLVGNNISLNGTSSALNSSGILSYIGWGAGNIVTATGNASFIGAANGAGTGSGVNFATTSWQNLVNSVTAGGSISFSGTNTLAANTGPAVSLHGIQANTTGTGSISVIANTQNSGTVAISIASAASVAGLGYQGGATSLVSASGDVKIQANQGSISLDDRVPSSVTSTTISGKNVTIDNTGGTITADSVTGVVTLVAGSGKAQSSSQGVLINDARAISASSNLNISGVSTAGVGIQSLMGAALTGGAVNLTGSSDGSVGVYMSGGSLTSTSGDIAMAGTSGASANNAVNLATPISANKNVLISGTNTLATNTASALYLNGSVTAVNGTIGLTADSSGATTQALRLNAGAALTTTNKPIVLTADTVTLAESPTTPFITAGTGTVTIQNKNPGVQISVGGLDVGGTTPTARTLGLSNAELNRISAANLVIGSSNAGNITVSSLVTTADATGDLALITGGNLAINAALQTGATATKNLTLNLTGSGSATQTTALKTNSLALLGSNASFTLNNASNDAVTMAANAKAVNYTDTNALTIGAVNTTTGLTATGDISVSAGGNLTLQNDVQTTGASNNITLASTGAGAAVAGGSNIITAANDTGAVTINSAGAGTLSGVISGGASLNKLGAGTTTLTSTNTYTGATSVSAGTLQVGNGGSVGTLGSNVGVTLANNASLVFNKSVDTTLDKNISGNGNVTAAITGNLALTGNVALIGTNNTINLSASGAITETAGSLGAANLYMTATAGGIGSSVNRIQTNVNNLAMKSAGNQYVTQANNALTVAAQTSSNGNVDIVASNGTLTVGGALNGITGITANGTGGVMLTGGSNALNTAGVAIGKAVSAGGNISIDGKSNGGFGVQVGYATGIYTTNAVGSPSSVTIKGVSAGSAGVEVTGVIQTTNGSTLRLEGTGTNGAKGIYGDLNNYGTVIGSATSGDITLVGTSTGGAANAALGSDAMLGGGYGVLWRNNIISQGKISITGTSDYQPGVFLQHSTYDYTILANRSMNDTQPIIQVVAGGAAMTGDAIYIKGTNLYGSTSNPNGVLISSKITNASAGGATTIVSDKGGVALLASTTVKSGVSSTGYGSISNSSSAGAINITAGTDAASTASIGTVLGDFGINAAGNPNVQTPWTFSAAGTNITQNGNAGVNLITLGQGNITTPAITNNGTGNVVIAAGSALDAGNGTGGQVLTVAGNTVTQGSTGKTYVYTGAASATGALSNLGVFGTDLYLLTIGSNTQNAESNTAYTSSGTRNTIASSANAQVMFREKVALSGSLNNAVITYGDSTGSTAITLALRLVNPSTTNLLATASNAGTFHFAQSDLMADLSSASMTTAQGVANNLSSSGNLKASSTGYAMDLMGNNYTLTGVAANLVVNQLALTGAAIADVTTTYGTPAGTGVVTFTNVKGTDKVNAMATLVGGATSSSGNLKAGVYKQTASGISGDDASNYTFAGVTTGTANYLVNKLDLTTDIAAVVTEYGTAANTGAVSIRGGLQNDIVTVHSSTTASLELPNNSTSSSGNLKAGTYTQAVTAGLDGADAGNYATVLTKVANYQVSPKAISATVTAADKVYDGTNVATLTASSAGILSGDKVNVLGATGTFASKNVARDGSGNVVTQAVTVSGSSVGLGGDDGANYTLTNATNIASTTATITPRALTASIADVTTIYGASAATGSVNLNGVVGTDQVATSAASLIGSAYSSSGNLKAGTYTQSVATGLGGADAGNYTFDGTSSSNYVVNKLALTTQIADVSAIYGTAAKTGAASVVGVLSGDRVDLSGSATLVGAVYSASGNLKAGSYQQTVGASLTGADADNYTAAPTSKANYMVTPKAIAATVTAADKVYDGNNVATLTANSADILSGDVVNVIGVTGTFASKNVARDGLGNVVAQAVTVTGSGASLGGADGANYTLTNASSIAGTTARITPKELTVTGITAADKVYDGSTTAALNTGNSVLAGVVAGDGVDVSSASAVGNFASKNVAFDANGAVTSQAVTVSSLSLNGQDAGNYTVTDKSAVMAKVLQRALSITGSVAQDKTVDGTTLAQVTPGQLGNLVAGESLLVTATGQFADAEIGTNKAVSTQYALANGSGIARNYTAPSAEVLRAAILAANVNPVQPIVSPTKPGGGGRVVVAGSSSSGAALGVAEDEDLTSREECSILNPEKCECQESTIAGVELCFAPGMAMNTKE